MTTFFTLYVGSLVEMEWLTYCIQHCTRSQIQIVQCIRGEKDSYNTAVDRTKIHREGTLPSQS